MIFNKINILNNIILFYMWDKIVNPSTNRKVSVNSKVGKMVINNYNTTAQTPEALYRLTESYLSIGIIKEAKKTTAVLSYNYKESNWYKLSYELFKKYGYKENETKG